MEKREAASARPLVLAPLSRWTFPCAGPEKVGPSPCLTPSTARKRLDPCPVASVTCSG